MYWNFCSKSHPTITKIKHCMNGKLVSVHCINNEQWAYRRIDSLSSSMKVVTFINRTEMKCLKMACSLLRSIHLIRKLSSCTCTVCITYTKINRHLKFENVCFVIFTNKWIRLLQTYDFEHWTIFYKIWIIIDEENIPRMA